MQKKEHHSVHHDPEPKNRLEEKKLSIEYCRKKLGKKASNFTDKDLEQLRDFLYLLAEIEYEHYKKNSHEESNPVHTRLN